MHATATIRDWAERTVARVAERCAPVRRVLELGCGSGMILFRIARLAGVERCVAADISAASTAYLEAAAPAAALPAAVAFEAVCPVAAHESLRFVGARLDTIVCNCVSQVRARARDLEPPLSFLSLDARRAEDYNPTLFNTSMASESP